MKPSVHTSGHSRWIRRSHRPDVLSSPNYRAHSSPFKRGIISRKVNQRKGLEASETCVIRRRQEKGASVFGIYIISYNAGYTKYREAKKPSFPDFGPFQRLLSLLAGWIVFSHLVWYSYAIYNNSTYMFLAVFYYNRPVTCRTFSSSNVQHFAARFGCGILTTSVPFSEQTESLV